MQIFALFRNGVSQGPGTSIKVPEVLESELWSLIQAKFAPLPDAGGTPKLVQRRDNPDVFELRLDADGSSADFQGGYSYFTPAGAAFELQEFEQFPNAQAACEARIDTFIHGMQTEKLQRGAYIE